MSGHRAMALLAVAAWTVLLTAGPAAAAPAPSPSPSPSPSPTPSPSPSPSPSPTPQARYIRVSPSTVEAGYLVGIEASCPDNSKPATAESRAFADEIVLQPQNGRLTSTATVRADADAISYRVVLDCPDTLLGGRTTLTVVTGNRPSRGPATGFGGTAGADGGTYVLAGGVAALAAGAVLAVVALRRRRTA
jgi:hypothetical protein